MNIKKSFVSILFTGFIFLNNLSAATFFSGYAGGKLNYSANSASTSYDPDLKLQAFFAGQFNFSQNVWSHLEFSIDTGDFISESLFHKTESLFQIDELSLIFRGNLQNSSNYLSIFMGTYDPIGSDVFLQRYFNIENIASKLTDSYLGLQGSILYPHFGLGISDIVKLHELPMAFGGYLYVNHEDTKYFVLNMDMRAACVFPYFTMDFAGGIGAPIVNKYKGEDVIFAIDTIYWHAGTTILIGNNYTTSLFIQAGLYNASFTAKNNAFIVAADDIYLLFEPRFYSQNFHFNISLYSLPEKTVEELLYVDNTMGVNFNIYSDSAMIGSKVFTLGTHLSFSLIDKNIFNITDYTTLFSNGYDIDISPYLETDFLSGQLHMQLKFKAMEITRTSAAKAFSLDLGYRTTF
ncbi:MAG: hypothetical protein K5829_10190 [Treponema sp.]|nr:hypothetical protein [Treponema sp.]